MLNPPSSEPSRRGLTLRGAGAWFALLAVFFSGSCVFDLPALEPDAGIGGNSGLGGAGGDGQIGGNAGNPAGASSLGGTAGGGDPSCPGAQKLCGETCRPLEPAFGCSSSSCEPCLDVPGAEVGCVEGQCAVLRCLDDFADCDGDTINRDTVGNGCEYPLGPLAATVTSLDVIKRSIAVDGKRDDWSGIPAYSFDQVCANCRDDNTPPITADSSIPARNDLDGRFRVAWDGDFFYVFVEAFDNHPFNLGDPVAEGCQHGAECEDAVQLFLAGRNNRSGGYSNENHRVFLGLSQRFVAPAQGQPALADVEISAQLQGTSCYRLEAKIDWAYITGTKGGGQAPGHFPPAPAQSYGFNLALNDWDPAVSDANRIERQSQIFWSNPGTEFSFSAAGMGEMTLRDGSDAGP